MSDGVAAREDKGGGVYCVSGRTYSARLLIVRMAQPLRKAEIDRLDILSAVLGPAVYVHPRAAEEVRRHLTSTAADLERRARREPNSPVCTGARCSLPPESSHELLCQPEPGGAHAGYSGSR